MINTKVHDWITFHRLQFPEPVSSLERVFPPVVGPDCWLFGPHYDVGPDGMLTGVSNIWAGVGIWHNRAEAEAMVAAYQPGTHRSRIDEDKAGLLSDRSAFTRLRVIDSWGDWDGEVSWIPNRN